MMRAIFTFLVVLTFATYFPAGAKPVPKLGEILQLKFENGQDYFVESTTIFDSKGSNGEEKLDSYQEQIVVIQLSPDRQLANDVWLVNVRIVGLRYDWGPKKGSIAYDSTQKNEASETTFYFDSLLETKFIATVRPDGEIRSLIGREGLRKSIAKAFPSPKEILLDDNLFLRDAELKKIISPIHEFLSARPERIGARGES